MIAVILMLLLIGFLTVRLAGTLKRIPSLVFKI